MMYILNIVSAIKTMTIKELKSFIFKNYYKQVRFSRENNSYSINYQKNKYLLFLATKLKPDASKC